MPETYEVIETKTLATAVADVYFNSIPQTYTDLVLVIEGELVTGSNCCLRFNGDNTTNYNSQYIYGNGTSAVASRLSNRSYLDGGGMSSGTRSNNTFQIFNYANATTNKTVLVRTIDNGAVYSWAAMWRGVISGINSINVLSANGANYIVGTTMTLYGIKAA